MKPLLTPRTGEAPRRTDRLSLPFSPALEPRPQGRDDAMNGLQILHRKSLRKAVDPRRLQSHGGFESAPPPVQILELLAGATNIILLGLNMRDGFRMTRRFRIHQPDRLNTML